MDTMNFDVMKSKSIRIMRSQRNPSLRKSAVGNVFIKNLDKSVDNRSLHDTFSLFGNILSCKVDHHKNGTSKGFAFVHFEKEESAHNAIKRMNGLLLNSKKVFVGKFIPRVDREKEIGKKDKKYTNLYVKNFGEEMTKENLYNLFCYYGEINSHIVMTGPDGKSKGFAFVDYKEFTDAKKAEEALNGKEINGKTLYVGRAQNKDERESEFIKMFDAKKQDRIDRTRDVNLYVKNLDSIDDERLRKEFSPYGVITSSKVMEDEDGKSRRFGFVCFSDPEEAARAVIGMNNKILVTKPLYVGLAQRKEERKALLSSQYMRKVAHVQRVAANMSRQRVNQMYQAPPNQHLYMHSMEAQPTSHSSIPAAPMSAAKARWSTPAQRMRSGVQAQAFAGMQCNRPVTIAAGPLYTQHNTRVPNQGMLTASMTYQPPNMAMMAVEAPRAVAPGVAVAAQMGEAAAAARTLYVVYPPTNSEDDLTAVNVQNQEPLTTDTQHPTGQKQMLGERLYHLVRDYHPGHCGKITGMLLEMDNPDLLHLLENQISLRRRVDEALAVLEAHRA